MCGWCLTVGAKAFCRDHNGACEKPRQIQITKSRWRRKDVRLKSLFSPCTGVLDLSRSNWRSCVLSIVNDLPVLRPESGQPLSSAHCWREVRAWLDLIRPRQMLSQRFLIVVRDKLDGGETDPADRAVGFCCFRFPVLRPVPFRFPSVTRAPGSCPG